MFPSKSLFAEIAKIKIVFKNIKGHRTMEMCTKLQLKKKSSKSTGFHHFQSQNPTFEEISGTLGICSIFNSSVISVKQTIF